MTDGGSQGIFVVVAVVIFGIFVGISYLLYRDQMSPALAKLFCDAITMTSERTGFASGLKGCDIQGDTSKDPIVVSYHKIRDADDAKGWSEVWVQIHELDNGNVEIIDSGNQDLFEDETYGNGLLGEISFPDQIAGKDVEIIGKSALQYAKFTNIMKLPSELIILDSYSLQQSRFSGNAIFPEKIEIIGTEALRDSRFSGKLTDLPPSIIEIGEGAFQESVFEGEFNFPEGDKNFEGSSPEGSVSETIPNTIIGDKAFENSKFIGNITIPDYITEIGNDSFKNSNFSSITFPSNSSITMIGDSSFENSVIKGTVIIPSSVVSIGKDSFKNSQITKLTIPKDSEIETIGDGAFEYSMLGGILWLPDSVKYIGDRAFYTAVFVNNNWILPTNLEYLGDYAFYNSNMIGRLTSNNRLKRIGSYSFYKSFSTQSKTTPSLYDGTWLEYSSVHDIVLGTKLEEIGESAFYSAKFKNFDMRKAPNLKRIEKNAFYSSFNQSASNTTYGGTRIRKIPNKIYFNSKIEFIGESAFRNARFNGEESIILPSSLKTVQSFAFYNSFIKLGSAYTFGIIYIHEHTNFSGNASQATKLILK